MGVFKTLFFSSLLISTAFIAFQILDKEDISHIKNLPYKKVGNKTAKTMLIFLHGYPNTLNLWNDLTEKLKSKYLCISISYPNYSEELKLRWGLSFEQIVPLIKKTIDLVQENNKSSNANYEKVLIGHDWGSILTFKTENAYGTYFKEIWSFDVTMQIDDSKIQNRLMAVTYQTYLASAFFIGGPIGNKMTRLFYNLIKSKIYGNTEEDNERIDSSWNYFYFYLYRNIFQFREQAMMYKSKVPIVYMYGKDKRFMFHSAKFLEMLSTTANSEVHELEGDHWFMAKNLDFIVDKINKRN